MKLVDKAAVVAEINRLVNKLYYEPENFKDVGAKMALDSLKSFLDTLEVKEVDLEEEIDDYVNEHFSECDDGVLISDDNSRELTLLDITPLAKHFFELGIKTQKGE